MKSFRHAVIPLIAVLFFSVLAPLAPARAAPAGVPITCGMVVNDDAQLYLARDLHCLTTFGVLVTQVQGEPSPAPDVQIDLRGHTLSGPGSGGGIINIGYPGTATTQVHDGRLRGWGSAVGGDTEIRVRNVALVENDYGFSCNGNCYLDRSYVSRNSEAGLDLRAEANAVVTRTTFVGNKVGAQTGYIYPLNISDSVFLKNDIAAQALAGQVTVTRSIFVKNRIGVLVTDDGVGSSCATLSRNIFIKNRTNVIATRC